MTHQHVMARVKPWALVPCLPGLPRSSHTHQRWEVGDALLEDAEASREKRAAECHGPLTLLDPILRGSHFGPHVDFLGFFSKTKNPRKLAGPKHPS